MNRCQGIDDMRPINETRMRTRRKLAGARQWSPARRDGNGRTIRSAAARPRERRLEWSRCRCGRAWRTMIVVGRSMPS